MTPPPATVVTETAEPKVDSLLEPAEAVSVEEAVRQRVQLHPQAHAQEIAAMLELDGIQPPLEVVQRVLDESRSENTGQAIVNSPPATRQPR